MLPCLPTMRFPDAGGTFSVLFWGNRLALGLPGLFRIESLNGLEAPRQVFATGTAGSDFAISSAGSTHTFNLPSASTTARGAVTTSNQTFLGTKVFQIASLSDSAATSSMRVQVRGGSPAAGYGVLFDFRADDDGSTLRTVASLQGSWANPATASYQGRLSALVEDSAGTREVWRGQATGSAPAIGFLGASAAARQSGDIGAALVLYGLMSSAAYPTATSGESVLASTFAITAANDTYEASGLSVALPSAGTYLIQGEVRGEVQGNTGAIWYLTGKLRNTTDSSDLANSERVIVLLTIAGGNFQPTTPFGALVAVDGGKTIELYVKSVTNGSFTQRNIVANADGRSVLRYLKIAP